MKLQIRFCYRWNYGKEAARVAEELFSDKTIRYDIIEVSLKEAPPGYFIVKLNDKIIFNNKSEERMLTKGEIIELIKNV